MSWFEAIILGLIQGLTEFLPVSSSGHLIIAKELFGIETHDLAFEVVVHAATVLSTIVVFRKSIWELLRGLFEFKYNEPTRYILLILVSMVPVMIVGFFFKDYVEKLFGSGLLVVGLALMGTSFLLTLSERIKPRKSSDSEQSHSIGWKAAIWMGVAQAVAVIPGLSRSGSTIATGLICGVSSEQVTRFSFLMVLIPVLGEAFLEFVGGGFAASSTAGELELLLGFAAAFLSGIFACKVMIAIVKKARLKWFALYCAIAGIACIVANMF
ncbi:MAG TPA: undecaprenyl-diphosphate phosphatase [Bacteroidales bacterium]|nr:undecaprenyl-diphosphate phosphatase [Bacteroidales bacterium]HPK30291.1 undecaprenyl-diphosphate phosphatase [Bacteroidales bacterium]